MTARWLIAVDHPAVRGHFPGNPIMPGAVLLGEVLHAIETRTGTDLAPFQISNAKFFHSARPGDALSIEFSIVQNQIEFSCTASGKTLLTGILRCSADSLRL